MIVYKKIDQYSRDTGKKIGTANIVDHYICDFSGDKIDEHSNPNTYSIDYSGNDPCFGDAEGEGWFFDSDYGDYHFELFSQSDYIFKEVNGLEIFNALITKATANLEFIYSLEHLLRWSRGKMLEKVFKEDTYKIEQFIDLENI